MIARRDAFRTVAGGVALAALGGGVTAAAPAKGRYIGRVVTDWGALDDGRHMRLLEPFGYVDPGGHRWDVPAGAIIDGASIPRAAWALIGGPFEGRYRNASVVHDWYCDVRTERWEDVHRMFLAGMLDSGVSEYMANVMYLCVYAGGPRWDDQTIENNRLVTQKVAELSQGPAATTLRTCAPDGSNCQALYQSPALVAATRKPSANPFEALFSAFRPKAMMAAVEPPPSARIETVAVHGAQPPAVSDPQQLLELAQRLARARTDLGAAEAQVNLLRTPGA